MNIDLNKVPKQFCENVTVGFTQESFVMGLLNGENGTFYVLTPEHMKRLSQYLTSQVADYEKAYKKIDAKWSPGIESPYQTKDISDKN